MTAFEGRVNRSLPLLREQDSRHMIQIASIGGGPMMRRISSEDEYGNLDKKK
jgi:hypothetical protein